MSSVDLDIIMEGVSFLLSKCDKRFVGFIEREMPLTYNIINNLKIKDKGSKRKKLTRKRKKKKKGGGPRLKTCFFRDSKSIDDVYEKIEYEEELNQRDLNIIIKQLDSDFSQHLLVLPLMKANQKYEGILQKVEATLEDIKTRKDEIEQRGTQQEVRVKKK